MATTQRREDALSRQRIVDAAVALLDAAGAEGLTFRALATQLKTGPGAIYWHVANKNELLIAATDAVLARAMSAGHPDHPGHPPEQAIRAVAVGVFDAIDAHPWAGTQLALAPAEPVMLRIFESLGQQVQALGVPAAAQFTATSALLNYILGVAGQNAATARAVDPATNRTEFLGRAASAWAGLDPAEYPFTRTVADQLRDHDDRAQFLDGVDLILTGIAALGPNATGSGVPHQNAPPTGSVGGAVAGRAGVTELR